MIQDHGSPTKFYLLLKLCPKSPTKNKHYFSKFCTLSQLLGMFSLRYSYIPETSYYLRSFLWLLSIKHTAPYCPYYPSYIFFPSWSPGPPCFHLFPKLALLSHSGLNWNYLIVFFHLTTSEAISRPSLNPLNEFSIIASPLRGFPCRGFT